VEGLVIWAKKGKFEKSTAQRFSSSTDNPQKDNFHNLNLVLTKDVFNVLLIQQS